jgi:spermidine synthase
MIFSGFAGLGYQIVWTRQAALWLGHEIASVLAVVTAFFGGLALGAWALGDRLARSPRPARAYALCECVIGGWSLALAWLAQPVSGWLLQLVGAQPSPAWQASIAFGGTLLLLLPATAAMGATLPAIHRALTVLQPGRTAFAGLYAANTLGAVAGVLASALWLIPSLGLRQTALVCAGLNGLCALLAWTWPAREAAAPIPTARPHDRLRAGALLWLTGLLGIGYEVLAVRVLGQLAENTVYTFALLLAVYLVGTALGAAAWQHWGRDRAVAPHRLLGALAAAGLTGAFGLWGADRLQAALSSSWGGGLTSALAIEATLALAAFAAPTLAMGAVFSALAERAQAQGMGLGRALALNTLGAALAPPLFGVLWVPAVGTKAALLLLLAAYLLPAWRRWTSPAVWAPATALALMALALPPLHFIDVPEGGRLVQHHEGALGAVNIVEHADGSARLHIDNRAQEGGNATFTADARQALLPLLLHPQPQRALFLGLGTGVTAASAAVMTGVAVDAVELLPEVIAASSFFTQALTESAPSARLRLLQADARRYLRSATEPRYDVIVADNVHPARSGSGSLYTVEHFQAVRARLADGGLFCQWLPLHQMDLATLRSIVRSFQVAFPQGGALLATLSLQTPVLGLFSHDDGRRLEVAALGPRVQRSPWPRSPSEVGLPDAWAVAGSVVAGPSALASLAGDAPLNTDDHTVVASLAPAATYAAEASPQDRLLALLPTLDVRTGELFALGDTATAGRLAAYRQARDRFLLAGRDVRPSADVRQMLAQVQAPLLQVLALSPDFRPAYDPLLRMAEALSRQDPAAAAALLSTLHRLQPARPEAGVLLQELGTR